MMNPSDSQTKTNTPASSVQADTAPQAEAWTPRSITVLVDGRSITVLLDNDDGEAEWGSAHDSAGNRIEAYVFDGDPYDTSPVEQDPVPPSLSR